MTAEAMHKSKSGVRPQDGRENEGRPKPTARRSLRDILEAANSLTKGQSGESRTDGGKGEVEVTSKASNPKPRGYTPMGLEKESIPGSLHDKTEGERTTGNVEGIAESGGHVRIENALRKGKQVAEPLSVIAKPVGSKGT